MHPFAQQLFFSNATFAPPVLKLHGIICAKNKTYDCAIYRRKITSLLLYSDLEPAVYTANVYFYETYLLLTADAWVTVLPNLMYEVACNFTSLSKNTIIEG